MTDPRTQQLTVILAAHDWVAFRDLAPAHRMPGETARVEITQFGALDAAEAISRAKAGEGRAVEVA